MILVAIGVIAFGAYKNFNLEAVMHSGHKFEIIAIASVFALIFIPNLARMWWFTILKPKIKASPVTYFKGLSDLIVHMFTQKRTLDCEDNTFRWFEHLILVIGYLTLLFTTVVLDWFSSQNMLVIVLGYLVSFIILIVTIDFVADRIRKKKELSKYSQMSDWMFVIWLALMGISAFAVRLFLDLGILHLNLWLYLVHLIILVQWALIIVPFGKWTHFLYRSFAMYFARIRS
jgi:quinone-modifying oxidoreductase subunit QmoC